MHSPIPSPRSPGHPIRSFLLNLLACNNNADCRFRTSALSHGGKHNDFADLLDILLLNDDICEYNAVMLVNQPGVSLPVHYSAYAPLSSLFKLRASDLRTLPSSSHLTKAISSAPASLQLPYLRRSVEQTPEDFAMAIARRCGSHVVNHPLGTPEPVPPYTNKKHVICVGMPPLEGTATHRKATLANHGEILGMFPCLSIL